MPANMKMGKNATKQKRIRSKRESPFGMTRIIPPSRRVWLSYAERVGIGEAAAGAGVLTSFSLNSLFDPNSGGVGSQPIGFDQLSALYGQYRVWRTIVKLTAANTGQVPTMIVVFGTYQPAAPSNPDAWFCQPGVVSNDIEPPGGRSTKILRKTFDIPTVLGLTQEQYRSDMDFVGTSSGSPTRQAYMMYGGRSLTTTVANISFYVQISYEVEFSQPIPLGLS